MKTLILDFLRARALVVGALLCASLGAHGATFTSQLITNLPPVGGAAFSSDPSGGVALGGFFYFAASDGPNGTTGRELWRTDGTVNGTTLVKDINPGAADSSPDLLTVAGTNLFFVANDGMHGREVWKSDGTAAGTKMVADVIPGAADPGILAIKAAGNDAYFTAAYFSITNFVSDSCGHQVELVGRFGELFKSDGTTPGTVQLAGPNGLLTTNGLLLHDEEAGGGFPFGCGFHHYFDFDPFATGSTNAVFAEWAIDGSGFFASNVLWRTDGTVPGSVRLEAIDDYVQAIRVIEPQCYFVTGVGSALKRRSLSTGGTSETVVTAGGLTMETVVNGRLFYSSFKAEGSVLTGGCSHESSFGSVANGNAPVMIEYATNANCFVSVPHFGAAATLGGMIYYTSSFEPQKLFRTDGLTAGTVALDFQTLGIFPSQYLLASSRLFFTGNTTFGVTDTTIAGTRILLGQAGLLSSLGTNVFLSANDGINGNELWRSDGTTNGTALLKDLAPGTDSPPPIEAIAVGTNLFFSLPPAQLWKSGGTAAGTVLVKDFGTAGFGPTNLLALNGLLYFAANDGTNGMELWRSDGTASGTLLLRDFGTAGFDPTHLAAWNSLLYFAANDGTNGMELWRSDGTASGTFMVKDGRVGASGSNPSQLVAAGNLLFFVADDGAHGAELWRSDGTSNGTFMAEDIVPGLDPAQIGNLSAIGNVVYFIAKSGSLGRELWASTGQPGGTQFLKDLNPGSGDSSVSRFISFAGAVYFLADGSLWRTDGTPSATTLIKPGSFGDLQLAGGSIFAAAASQLWTSDGTTDGTTMVTNPANSLSQLTTLGSNIFFAVKEDLWTSDGTVGGTVVAADLPDPGAITSPSPSRLTPFLGALVFTANTPTFGNEFWTISPGQTATMIEDLEPGAPGPNIRLVTPATDKIFYFARPSGNPAWQVRALQLQSLSPPPRSPWNGSPAAIPARIEAEDFDIGGEAVAYHDTTLVNEGGQHRKTEAVDIETTTDTDGAFSVAFTQPGEWLEYTFQTAIPGSYRLDLRVSANGAGAAFHAAVDGVTTGGTNAVPDTASAWTTLSVPGFMINTGVHVLRLAFDSTNSSGTAGSVNWLEWVLTSSNQPPTVTNVVPAHGAFFAPDSSIALSANVSDATTATPPVTEFFIDDVSVGVDSSSPYHVSWTATAGAHVLRVRATDSFGATGTSSGQLFFVATPVIALGPESGWLYLDTGTNLGSSWRAVSFNDSAWPQGRAQLGFGDGDETTVLARTNLNGPIITYYFRKHFKIRNQPPVNYATITLLRDDGGVVYLNGQEIGRANLPVAPANILFSTPAVTNINNVILGSDAALDTFILPPNVFTNDVNVIAVEIHQAATTPASQFDISFDLALSAFSYNPGAALAITSSKTTATVHWPDYLTDWQLEQSTNLTTWTPITRGISVANGFFDATLTMGPAAFFRLRQLP